ncbi:MAG TPA: efflux RND transporter periplasmic adaptor subunit [Isosphaeraceae bacterium]|nr:efflux RND transporter periplasmic adaptor subunit [Isosphaeraceae bacterium]
MSMTAKTMAMAGGLVAALAAATLAQNPQAQPQGRSGDTVVVGGTATVDWIEKSAVAALKEGVIDKMELQVGAVVKEGDTIGILHREIAELTVAKAKLAATNTAALAKAEAQQDLAIAILARSKRLRAREIHNVSDEELQKNEAEVKVAAALIQEAKENRKLAEAELAMAVRALKEHTIVAPFDGVITEREKNPGESVRANEPVVRMGKIDKLRVVAWVPIDLAYRVKVGDWVEVMPNIPGAVLPIEQKRFRGKITFVDPEAEPVEYKVRVMAEVENNQEHELRPGLKADLIIYLNGAVPPGAPGVAPAVGARPVSTKR